MWTKPKSDGGKKIQGYVVEYKEVSSNRWKPYNETPIKETFGTGELVVIFNSAEIFTQLRSLTGGCSKKAT